MAKERVERRLAAILVADVVGYSRLIGGDEVRTRAQFNAHLEELIEPAISSHEGRIVKTTGDGLLVEFASVVEAVECAVDIQQGMVARNAGEPDDRQMEFRIGVNLGDVIIEGDDIHGDGVNVAARLEGLADQGGIVVSGVVHESVRTKLAFGFEDLGPQKVKNIADPVQAYRVSPEGHRKTTRTRTKTMLGWRGAVFLATALATTVTVVVWFGLWQPSDSPASLQQAKLPLPSKPSIVVLPFDNISRDPDQEYFVDGMTDDLITDLSRISGLFVIARNSSFTYKGRGVKVQQVAAELGVRYVLEGSVRRAGGNIRINAQLIDATTGGNLWADRYDGILDNIFALQDRITKKIVDALALKLTAGEVARSTSRDTNDTRAYDAFLLGWEHYLRFTPRDFEAAVAAFEKAVALDPGYARANAALAATYWQSWKRQWHGNIGFTHAAWARADEFLTKAMVKPSSLAYQVSSEMLTINKRYDEAVANAQRAIFLNSNRAPGYVALAEALTYAGRAQEAIEPIRNAMRLDPNSPAPYLLALGRAQLALMRFEEAASTLERAVLRGPSEHDARVLLIAAYGHLDRKSLAARAIVKLNELRNESGLSPFTQETLRNRLPYKERPVRDSLLEGLRKAGLQEW